MTDDIVAFITARLDEDERLARAVEDNSAPWVGQWKVDGEHALRTYNDWVLASHFPEPFRPGFLTHVARHDPARVLRGVEAKRQILNKVAAWQHQRLYDDTDENAGPYSCSRDGHTCECGVLEQQLDVLRPTASEWSTHESYREEWKP